MENKTEFFYGKKVLVTGGTGFVGANLVERLKELGAIITVTCHKHFPKLINGDINYFRADLTDKIYVRRVMEGQDYVFMCAANTSGAAVIEKTPLAHVTPNVIMNTLALEAAYLAGVKKFLFISSNTVYPVSRLHVKEEQMMSGPPYEKYFGVAWMKRFTEILCEVYSTKIKEPMQTVVVRPANIYGEHDDFEWETSHVVPALIRKVVERHDPVEVWGDGSDIKDLIYVKDFVDGALLAMEKLTDFLPINIATGRGVTLKGVLRTILEIDGYKDARIVYDASKPTMIPKRLISTLRAEKLLGFKARTSLKEGLLRTIKWYREGH